MSLPDHVKREVKDLLESFALQQRQKEEERQLSESAAPQTKPQRPSQKLMSVDVARLAPTRQSFAQLLRVYKKRATAAEIDAMLESVAEPLSKLISASWAAETKRLHGNEIRRIFARIDRDHSGGIDVSEFAAAVEEVGLDESSLRQLFDASDKDGNGGECS